MMSQAVKLKRLARADREIETASKLVGLAEKRLERYDEDRAKLAQLQERLATAQAERDWLAGAPARPAEASDVDENSQVADVDTKREPQSDSSVVPAVPGDQAVPVEQNQPVESPTAVTVNETPQPVDGQLAQAQQPVQPVAYSGLS